MITTTYGAGWAFAAALGSMTWEDAFIVGWGVALTFYLIAAILLMRKGAR